MAVKDVRRRESYAQVVVYLLRRIEGLGVRVSCLYLDRQFYRIDVINLLEVRASHSSYPSSTGVGTVV